MDSERSSGDGDDDKAQSVEVVGTSAPTTACIDRMDPTRELMAHTLQSMQNTLTRLLAVVHTTSHSHAPYRTPHALYIGDKFARPAMIAVNRNIDPNDDEAIGEVNVDTQMMRTLLMYDAKNEPVEHALRSMDLMPKASKTDMAAKLDKGVMVLGKVHVDMLNEMCRATRVGGLLAPTINDAVRLNGTTAARHLTDQYARRMRTLKKAISDAHKKKTSFLTLGVAFALKCYLDEVYTPERGSTPDTAHKMRCVKYEAALYDKSAGIVSAVSDVLCCWYRLVVMWRERREATYRLQDSELAALSGWHTEDELMARCVKDVLEHEYAQPDLRRAADRKARGVADMLSNRAQYVVETAQEGTAHDLALMQSQINELKAKLKKQPADDDRRSADRRRDTHGSREDSRRRRSSAVDEAVERGRRKGERQRDARSPSRGHREDGGRRRGGGRGRGRGTSRRGRGRRGPSARRH